MPFWGAKRWYHSFLMAFFLGQDVQDIISAHTSLTLKLVILFGIFFEKRTMPHFASNCVQWTIHFKTVDKFAQFPDKCSECSRKKPFHHPISFPWKTLFHNILKFKLTVITTVVVFILTKHHSHKKMKDHQTLAILFGGREELWALKRVRNFFSKE